MFGLKKQKNFLAEKSAHPWSSVSIMIKFGFPPCTELQSKTLRKTVTRFTKFRAMRTEPRMSMLN